MRRVVQVLMVRLRSLGLSTASGFSRGAGDIGLRRRRWFGAALGWWLAFDPLLRPAEVLRLRHCDLAFPNSELHGPDPNLVVVIRNPKTRRVWKTQFVLCTEAPLIDWLRWWCTHLRQDEPLLGLSRHQWSSYLKQAVQWLCIDEAGYTLSSFRSGGATHHFRTHENLGTLQYRGRWNSPSTLQYYLHEAMSAHVTCRISALGEQRAAAVRSGVEWLKKTPRLSAARFFS